MCQILTDRAHQLAIEEVHHRLGGIVGKMVPILDMLVKKLYQQQDHGALIQLNCDSKYPLLFQI